MKYPVFEAVQTVFKECKVPFTVEREGHHYKLAWEGGKFTAAESGDPRAPQNAAHQVRRRLKETLMTQAAPISTGTTKVASGHEDAQLYRRVRDVEELSRSNLNSIVDLIKRVTTLENLVLELQTRPQRTASQTHITAATMASRLGCSSNGEAVGFLKMYARSHARKNNLEIKKSEGNSKRKYEYFPLVSAEYAMAELKRSGLL